MAHVASPNDAGLATASARCVPVLREIAWLLAAFDLELIATYITSKDNLVSDVLSRAFTGDLPDGALGTVERWLQARAARGPWELWPAEASPRPAWMVPSPQYSATQVSLQPSSATLPPSSHWRATSCYW